MRWAGHEAHAREMKNAYQICWETLKERDHLGDLGVDGKIIFNGS
jgi:hypothetical protein